MKSLMIAAFFIAAACTTPNDRQQTEAKKTNVAKVEQVAQKVKLSQDDLEDYSKAYFASGCFWCVEAVFESVEGVVEAVSGYQGGHTLNPTYEQIGTGQTGHAEAVEVYYDANKVSYETLLKVFFGSHDPTTLNKQGPDRGTQYRSAIFFQNESEKDAIGKYIRKLQIDKVFDGRITTEIKPYVKFWKAEDYHQDFERRNPNQGYVRAVSIPRLKKFQAKYPELLKDKH